MQLRPVPLKLLLCAALGLSLGACAARPILIGVSVGVTGLTSGIGVMGRNGIELAAIEINAAGGIRGRPLQLLFEDDGDDPDRALDADRRLVEAGAVALIGHMSSKSGAKAVAFANEARVPLLSPTISSTDHSRKDDYFFRLIGENELQGRTLATWALAQGLRRASGGREATNSAYTLAVWRGFAETFTAGGGTAVAPVSFTTSREQRYDLLADEMLAGNPDLVMLAASSYDVANLCQEFRKRGSNVQVLASLWARTDDLMSFGGRSVEGVVAAGGLDPRDPGAATSVFRTAFEERYGEAPDFGAIYGYETMRVLAAALAQARRLDGPSIRQALLELGPLEGLQSPLAFDRYGDGTLPYRLFRVEDSAFRTLP